MIFDQCENCKQPLLPRRCLACGALVDSHLAADLTGNCPKVGDVSVCLYCANIAIFTEAGLREMARDERESVLADEQLGRAVIAVREMHERGLVRTPGEKQ